MASNFCVDHLWTSEVTEKKLWRDLGLDYVGEAEGGRVAVAAARERVVFGRDERVMGVGFDRDSGAGAFPTVKLDVLTKRERLRE